MRWTKKKVRLLTYGGIVFAYVCLWVLLGDYALKWQPWIELVNGATWPEHPEELKATSNTWFAACLALRIFLNFGSVLAVLVVVVEYLLIKKEAAMKVSALLNSRQTAVLNAVAKAMNVTSAQQRKLLDDAAKDAARQWNERYLPTLIGKAAAQDLMNTELEVPSVPADK
jgi:hypothetical protein